MKKEKVWHCPKCEENYQIIDIYIDEETGLVQPCPKCGENLELIKIETTI